MSGVAMTEWLADAENATMNAFTIMTSRAKHQQETSGIYMVSTE